MPRKGPNLVLTKNSDGNMVIFYGNFRSFVYLQNKSEWEQFQAVKNEILKMGVVFSRKIEKNVEKCLYSKNPKSPKTLKKTIPTRDHLITKRD